MTLKTVFKTIEWISPYLTAKIAFNHISNPRVKKFRPFEKPILEHATKSTLKFKKHKIAVYQWGTGEKAALLSHGWEGRASNFGAIIPLLIKKNYTVIGFDAPSHGNSSKRKTSFFDICELIEFFLKKETYNLIITHSMGSVMTLMAMSKLNYRGNQLIVCTTPDKFEDYIEQTVNHFGLTHKTKNALIDLVRKNTIYEPLALQASIFVKNIMMNKATFIHDKNDKVLNISNSKKVSSQMKNAEFIELENTGHFKLLWSNKTLNIINKRI